MGHRIKLTVAYLGGGFSGWQRQREGRTVQGELERALTTMTKAPSTVAGAGRTDTGVHAAAQVAHTDLPAGIQPPMLVRALNQSLDPFVRVRAAVAVGDSFHARHDALGKLYTYRVRWRPARLPWLGLRTVTTKPPTEKDRVHSAMALLVGMRDMASFSVPQSKSTVRTLHRAWAESRRDGMDIHFVGDGFLRSQVRRMLGAVLEVGLGRLSLPDFEDLLTCPQPGAPLQTAPAKGLTLERVFYRQSPLLQMAAVPPHNQLKVEC